MAMDKSAAHTDAGIDKKRSRSLCAKLESMCPGGEKLHLFRTNRRGKNEASYYLGIEPNIRLPLGKLAFPLQEVDWITVAQKAAAVLKDRGVLDVERVKQEVESRQVNEHADFKPPPMQPVKMSPEAERVVSNAFQTATQRVGHSRGRMSQLKTLMQQICQENGCQSVTYDAETNELSAVMVQTVTKVLA